MKRFLFTLFFCLILFNCTTSNFSMNDNSVLPDDIYNESSYELIFRDEFSSQDLDLTKWERCPEWPRQNVGGFWSNDCSYIENGNLVIESKKENGKLLSGAIRSKGKFESAGGLYKIRFKVPKTNGLWNAFWLMCESQGNIGNGAVDGAEIDIFEVISNDYNNQYLNSAVHWDGYGKNHKFNGSRLIINDDFYNKWHEIKFFWTKSGYKAYLDEKNYWDAKGLDYGGTNTKPCYLKITAEFGTWNGTVDLDFISSKMYVDYIEVYKQK